MRINITLPDELITDLDEYCESCKDDRSGVLAESVRALLYFRRPMGTMPVKNRMACSSTVEQIPVKDEVAGPSPAVPAKLVVLAKTYDSLWEDHNWLPVKKERLPDGFCATWHGEGVKRPLYLIKKIDITSKVVWEKMLCRDCVTLAHDVCKTQGGHLE